MPQPPNVEGLPVWLQIGLSIIFGVVTLVIAMRGYKTPARDEGGGNGAAGQHIDHGAIRALADACHTLNGSIVALERQIGELTHWTRRSDSNAEIVVEKLTILVSRLEG